MVVAAQLVAQILVEGAAKAQAEIAGVAASTESASAKFRSLATGGAVIAGVALVGIGVASVKMAGDFQSSMTRLVTSAGELPKNLAMISTGILKMSVDTGTSTEQLAKGMYYVESAGNRGAAALRVLQVAAQGAKTENADLDTVSKALTTTMTDYHMPVTQAAAAMNGLITTVKNGKTNLQDLSASMGQVLPIASAMHISFPQVAGAMDTITNAGVPAEQAAQNLAHVLVALEAPSKVATKAMLSVGLTSQQVKDALVNQGLPEALTLIEDHVGKKFPAGSVQSETALKNIMGGLVGLKLSSQLTGDSLGATEENIKKITAAMKNGGQAVDGFSAIQGNFNFKIDQGKMAIEALMISVGTLLLPVLGKILDAVTPLISKFSDWIVSGKAVSGMFGTMKDEFALAFEGFDFSKIKAAWNDLVKTLSDGTAIKVLTRLFYDLGFSLGNILPPLLEVAVQIGAGLIQNFKAALPAIESFIMTFGKTVINLSLFVAQALDAIAKSGLIKIAFDVLSVTVKLLSDAIVAVTGSITTFITWLKNGGMPAQIFKDALVGIAVAFTTIKAVNMVSSIVSFITLLPTIIGLTGLWAAATWTAAAAMIAATWPILAIGAAIAILVAGIILAIQHWGQIMDWLSGKTEQLRIKVEQEHVKMKIAVDDQTAAAAVSAIKNMEKQRAGILQKLKETHDPAQRAELEHQLKVVDIQVQGQAQRIRIAEIDKKRQLEKQKELHDNMIEAQKNWFQRMLDSIGSFFGNIFSAIGTFAHGVVGKIGEAFSGLGTFFHTWFTAAWNAIVQVFTPLGKWFSDQWKQTTLAFSGVVSFIGNVFAGAWKAIVDVFSPIGKWFSDQWKLVTLAFSGVVSFLGNVFIGAWNSITNTFGQIGKWFGDRWNDVSSRLATPIRIIGEVFQTLWNIIVAIFTKVGGWFKDRFSEAWTGVTVVFSALGKWFGDRWNDVVAVFSVVAGWFKDRFTTAWNNIVTIFTILGKWFGDRWAEVVTFLTPIGQWFKDRFTMAWNNIVTIFTGIGKWFGDRWNDVVAILSIVGQWFKDRFTTAWTNIVAIFQGIGKWFGDRWNDVVNFLTPIGKWFQTKFTEAWNNIVAIFTPIGKWFSDRWNDVVTGVQGFIKTVGDKFSALGTAVQTTIKNMINGIIDSLNGGISGLESFLNFFGQGLDNIAKALGTTGNIEVVHLNRIPHYATGTDSHPGGPAIVGERGPELVMLPKGASVLPHAATASLLGVPAYAGGIGDVLGDIGGWIAGGAKSVIDNMMQKLNIHFSMPGKIENLASGAVDDAKKWAIGWVQKILPVILPGGGGGGSAGEGRSVNVPGGVVGWLNAAMALTGVPGNWLSALESIVMFESGGNPNAINLTDSNAQAGHPSQGLMQTIPSTFAANMVAGHGNILNPIDNAAAAINYIKGRYGSVFNVPGIVNMAHGGGYVGYANGTDNAPGGMAVVGERGPELMYVPKGAKIVPNSRLASGGGGTTIIINPPAIYLDGRQLTNGIMPHVANAIRYNVGTNNM